MIRKEYILTYTHPPNSPLLIRVSALTVVEVFGGFDETAQSLHACDEDIANKKELSYLAGVV